MIGTLVAAFFVLLILAMVIYCIQILPAPISPDVKPWLIVVAVVIAILVLLGYAGVGPHWR